MRKKDIKRLLWVLKNPVKAYKKVIMNSIIPKPYSHQVTMQVDIKKGNKSGVALVPCTIYAMDHSIDLNPSLIRKKDRKLIKHVDPLDGYDFLKDEKVKTYRVDEKKKVIRYNPDNISLEVTEEEKRQGYKMQKVELTEFERCVKCGQKQVISEVRQTRFRSCPEIHVKLGDKAKANTVIPVTFGVNKADVVIRPMINAFFVFFTIWATLIFFGVDMTWLAPIGAINIGIPAWIGRALFVVIFGWLWVYMIPRQVYGTIKLIQWYKRVKNGMKLSKYAYY